MKRNLVWIVSAVCILASVAACHHRRMPNPPLRSAAQKYSTRVTWIEDGDTITVVSEGQSQALRLYLIDAPEKGEPYSRIATDYLRHRILNEVIQVQDVSRVNHGRLLAFVWLNGELINLSLLREGLAYLAIYHPEEEAYREQAKAAVEEAKKNKRGVWR